MSVSKHSSWSYTEALPLEDAALTAARARGLELGVESVTPAVAQLITVPVSYTHLKLPTICSV